MLEDAKKHKYEDEEYKRMVVACKDLEVYIDKVKSKIKTQGEELKKIDIAIKDASHLLEKSKIGNVGEYKDTLEQLKELCDPIINYMGIGWLFQSVPPMFPTIISQDVINKHA
ncbi:heat shock 70 kDa protein-like [Rutidosis leptorrhynchoides]|uniref:heat shock 70 kDa protein-like n=1 Tax=Rutidosis leptorrhynchoides TaxID=125765 RepID=UPI003A995456